MIRLPFLPTKIILLCFAITIAAIGQAVTTRSPPLGSDALFPFAARLGHTYPRPESVVVAMVLLALGSFIFGVACRDIDLESRPTQTTAPLRFGRRLAWGMFALGAAALAVVLLLLRSDNYEPWLLSLFVLALVLLGTPFLEARGVSRLRLRAPALAQAALLLTLVAAFAIVATHDLDHWRFSALGDEYAFYRYAESLAAGVQFNPFSQEGVYGYHPVLSSAWQALSLKLFGGGMFAWKFSAVLLVAATLVPFYLFMRELFSLRAAIFATSVLSTSHYILAFTHTGYNNIDCVFPVALSLWLLVMGLRRESALAMFVAGAAAGLGFYTFYSARSTIVIDTLILVAYGRNGLRRDLVVPFAVAFAASVAPIFALHGTAVFSQMLDQSAAGFDSAATGPRLERVASNIVPSVMAFNVNPDRAKYVSGSLLDPLSATLFALGLGLAVSKLRTPAFRLLLIWWLVSVAVTGLAYPKPGIAITRLYFALLPAAALTGVALDAALAVVLRRWPAEPGRPVLSVVAVGVVFSAMLYLNLHRFWDESNRGTQPSAVAVGAFLSGLCQGQPATILTSRPSVLLPEILHAYRLGDRTPQLSTYGAPDGQTAATAWGDCLIVIPPDSRQFGATRDMFLHLVPDKESVVFSDRYGLTKVLVLRERVGPAGSASSPMLPAPVAQTFGPGVSAFSPSWVSS